MADARNPFDVNLSQETVEQMVSAVKFAAPPLMGRGNNLGARQKYEAFWKQIHNKLKESPGKWALVIPETHSGVPHQIRSGKNKHIDLEEFEMATRAVPGHPKRYMSIYLRYVGENGEFAYDA